jgi:hypothetical protein
MFGRKCDKHSFVASFSKQIMLLGSNIYFVGMMNAKITRSRMVQKDFRDCSNRTASLVSVEVLKKGGSLAAGNYVEREHCVCMGLCACGFVGDHEVYAEVAQLPFAFQDFESDILSVEGGVEKCESVHDLPIESPYFRDQHCHLAVVG